MLKSSFIIPMMFMFHSTMAQGIISGKLVDSQSRQPLEAAFISIRDGGRKALSDQYGNFYLPTQTLQTDILISCLGYKNRTIRVLAKEDLIIALEPTEIVLSAVTLEATRSSGSSNIAKIDLALKPVRNSQELLRVVPGIFIAQHAGGGKAEQIFMRGYDSDHGTDVLVSVDGMPVNLVSHAHGQGYADAHFILSVSII